MLYLALQLPYVTYPLSEHLHCK